MDKNKMIKEYSNDDITILWQPGKCIHSANCVRNLSTVFKPQEKPWIVMDKTPSADIIKAVHKCPSGALTIKGEA